MTALLLAACGKAPKAPTLPSDFLLTTADSAYWFSSGPNGLKVRGAPILITRVDGRFTQLYTTDVDRSYHDAVFIGQRLFRRDLVRGDSAELLSDTVVASLERDYRRAHPDARRLEDDEAPDPQPAIDASASIDILDVHGPYLSFEYRTNVDVRRAPRPVDRHAARRGVLDVRAAKAVGLGELFGAAAADRLVATAAAEWNAAGAALATRQDSAGRVALEESRGFAFDAMSFSLDARDRKPLVTLAVPGARRGASADPVTLTAQTVEPPSWWSAIVAVLPTGTDIARAWVRRGTRVTARSSDDEHATLSITDAAGKEWEVGVVTAPVQQLVWLDSTVTAEDRRGLEHAFAEWATPSGPSQVALALPRTPAHNVQRRPSLPLRARIGAHEFRPDDADGRERPRPRLRRHRPESDRQDRRRLRHAPRPHLGRHGLAG